MKRWPEVRLDEVCGIDSTLIDPRKKPFREMPHVGGANIESLTGKLLDLKTAEEEGLKSGKFLFDERVVLYSKIRPYLRKVARPNFRGLCSADIYPLSPINGRLDRDFLFHLLLTSAFTDYAIAGSARAGMPKVNRDHLFAFTFQLPTLAEQKRIAEILDGVYENIATAMDNTKRKITALEALKATLIDSAFTGNH
jgi:type I restriction enzyme S subunit